MTIAFALAVKPCTITIKDFCDREDQEAWRGLSTAFRNGVRCRINGKVCPYTRRQDLADAWLRGWCAAEEFIEAGGIITCE